MVSRILQTTICFLFLFILFIITPVVHAESGQTYRAGTSNLNIRTAPSSDSAVIGSLDDQDKITIFKESNGWGQTYYQGKEAWVALHYLYLDDEDSQENTAPAVSSTSHIIITEDNVRIRTGPSTAYHMSASANSGDTFQLIDSRDSWYKVMLSNGTTGWVASWLTDSTESAANKSNSSETTTNTAKNQSLSGYNIVLDPGHGGKDPGSIAANGAFEKDLILSTANIVAEKLRNAGATVIMTRSNDQFISLEERVNISNAYSTDAFISLHYDAFPLSSINGFSTHFYTPFGNDRKLAQSIQSSLAQSIPLNNREVMQSNYYVLRENSDLAVLIELGFITNSYDLSIVQTTDYQYNVAEGIKNGLINYFH